MIPCKTICTKVIFACVLSFLFITAFAQAPVISGFTPGSGKVGDQVIISGSGFSTTLANNVVLFGATKATVTAATSTSLTVNVPVGATYAPISVLNRDNALSANSLNYFVPTFTAVKTVYTASDFSAKVDFAGNRAAHRVVVGDLDDDGKPDLAVANNSPNARITTYRNNSTSGSITTSSLQTFVDFIVGTWNAAVAISDLDGDGKSDLIVTNGLANSISILRNVSTSGTLNTSSFASAVNFTTGWAPMSIAVHDLDGDGKRDIVVANKDQHTVSIFRNISTSGSITSSSFSPKVDISVGTNPYSVVIGDLNLDGKPDIITSNYTSSNISFLKNTATPGSISTSSFDPKVDYATATNAYVAALADLDGDSKLDIAVTNRYSASISVFRNTTTVAGTLSLASKVEVGTGSEPFGISAGDVNGDGKLDLLTANNNGNTVSFIRNVGSAGNISFASKVDFGTNYSTAGVAIADMDGDGKPELIFTNYNDGDYSKNISILRNNPIPEPTITTSGTLSAFNACSGTASAAQSLTINGQNLSANITMAPLAGFEYSTDGTNYSSSLTLAPTSGSVNATVYIRMVSNANGSASGNIVLSSTGATSVSLAASGNVSSQVWTKIYETTTPNRNASGSMVYTAGFGKTGGAASTFTGNFNKVKYRLENNIAGVSRWVEVSFDAWAGLTLAQLQIPDLVNLITIQRNISNIYVTSNMPGVNTGSYSTGRMEFWPYNYDMNATSGLQPVGSSASYDWDDNFATGGYGSFQIHNVTAGFQQTILAWNNHANGSPAEVGIGNAPSGHPDWTFNPVNGTTNFKVQIFVEGRNDITPSGNVATCSGTPTTLTAPNGSSYLWSTGETTASINTSTAGNYTVTVTDANGCATTTNATTVSISSPTVAGTVSATSTAICSGSTVQLSLSGNIGTIQWQSSPDNSSWTNIANATNATYTSGALTQTTYYRANVKSGACNAIATNTVTVTVTAAPVAATLSGNTAVCAGQTIQLTASSPSLTKPGVVGTALNFDGINDVAIIPDNNSLDITNAITIEAWVYPTKNNGIQNVFAKSSANPNTGYIFPRTDNGWTDFTAYMFIAGQWRYISAPIPSLNTWYHMAATYDGAAMKLYLNGTLVQTVAQTGTIAVNADPIAIGNQPGYSEYFGGSVDEIRLWNVARTQAQIMANKDVEIAAQANLVAYYNFNQGTPGSTNTSISSILDASGNNFHAAMSNFSGTGNVSNFISYNTSGTPLATAIWSSSDASIATVNSSTGEVTGVAAGTVTITHTINGSGGCSNATATRSIAVSEVPDPGTLSGNQSICTGGTTTFSTNSLGNALNFDGVNDIVNIPKSVTNDFTIEYWVRTTQASLTGTQWYQGNGIVDAEMPGGTTDFGTSLLNNKLAFGLGPADVTIFSNTNINTGNWTHVAVTRNGTTGEMRIYINGVLERTGTGSTGTRTAPPNIRLGSILTNLQYFNGSIDELRLWNIVRTAQQIADNYNRSVSTQAGLVAYYPFDQGASGGSNTSITSLTDISGNNNTGTLSGFAGTGSTSNFITGQISSSVGTWSSSNATIASVNSTTGAISGLAPGTATISYTVTGTGVCASSTRTATRTVTINALPSISYGATSFAFVRSQAINTLTPTATNTQSFSVSPALPSGLTLNTSTGVISGTPTAQLSSTAYTITGTSALGCTNTVVLTLIVNPAPPANLVYTPSSQTVRQNTAITTMATTISGDAATYSINPSLPAGLSINTSTGAISGTLTAVMTGSVTYTITATNTSGSTTSTITLIYNTAPTNISLSASAINENMTTGSTVGLFSATDADTNDSFTYSFITGSGDTDNSSFTISGNTLRSAAVFDFETKSSYSIRIKVTDAGGLSFEKTFTINVLNVNEGPTNISLSANSINENTAVGTTVGSLSSTDVDASETFTYALVSGLGDADNASFTISSNTLRSAIAFDFETKSSYSIRVKVTDAGGLSFERTFTINVLNVNEAPNNISLSATSINENAVVGTAIGSLSATDVDAAETFTYALVSGIGSTDNTRFTITGNTLQSNAVFDFETKASYSIRIKVTDAGGSSFEKIFTINILNVNEAPTNILLSASSINENAVVGTTIGSLSGTDVDAAETFTYALVSGLGDADNASFTISGNTLRSAIVFDFETKSSYSIRIKVTDAGGLSFEKIFTITVNDLDDEDSDGDGILDSVEKGSNSSAPRDTDGDGIPDFKDLDSDNDGVPDANELADGTDPYNKANYKDSDGDQVPDHVEAQDGTSSLDPKRNYKDSDGDGVPDYIEIINGTNPNDATSFKDTDRGGVPDYVEVKLYPLYGITATNPAIRTDDDRDTDGDGVSDYAEIKVGTNPNDAPATLAYSPSAVVATKGVAIGSITPTYSKGKPISYTITPSLPAGISLDVATGVISGTPTELQTNAVVYTITATNLGGSTSTTFSLTVNDVVVSNLNYNIKTQLSEQGKAIANMSPSSTGGPIVGYSISPALPAGLILNTITGVISGTRTQAITGTVVYTVTATNSGGSSSTTLSFTYNTTPTNILTSKANIYEGNSIGDMVGLLSTTDVDSPESHTYTLVSDGASDLDNAFFTIKGNQLLAASVFKYNTRASYVIRVRSTDTQGLYTEKNITISISQRPVIYGTSSEAYIMSTFTGTNNVSTTPVISKGYSSQLSILGSDIKSVHWGSGNGLSSVTSLSPVFRNDNTVTYNVTITNIYGSVVVIPFTVEVRHDYFVKPTNIITSRADGINDYFVVENIQLYPDNEVTIYDRNGKILTKMSNYNNRWDGRVNGRLLATDTYYYLIRFTSNPKIIVKGFITLINN